MNSSQSKAESNYLIGIDVGTSSAKLIVINTAGEVIYTTAPSYDFATPQPGWAECQPIDWWNAVVIAIRSIFDNTEVTPGKIAGIGLTGQMHGLVLLDAGGEVIRPCIMWNDQRTVQQCEAIRNKVGAERLLELSGNVVLPGFTAPKIAWVRDNEPAHFDRAAKVLLPKDYIRYRLSGEYFSEVSDASGTGVFDVKNRQWSKELLKAYGIPEDWMPTVTESITASTKISSKAAKLTGLLEGTPIVAGGGDQAAQAVGCGIVSEGVVSATFGTSGVVFAHASSYHNEPDGNLHAFCAAVPDAWHFMGVMLSAAGSFEWFCDTLGEESYDALTEAAAKLQPGSEGLLFLPYLSGERNPHPDPYARGVFCGLSLRHKKAHMARAVLEGVTYGMRDSLELMKALDIRPEKIVASGGGAKSPFWLQMMADIFKIKIVTVNATEGAAYGAALLAGVGADIYPSVEVACECALKITSEYTPHTEAYEPYYQHFKNLYPALKSHFKAMAKKVQDSSQ